MAARRFRGVEFTVAFLAVLLTLFSARGIWLAALGSALVYDEGPAKADVAVLLAGDKWGNRLTCAAHLVKQGYVPKVLVSGPAGTYGINEADAAIRWAVQQGYPAQWFLAVPHDAPSTRAEAVVLLNDMRKRNIHSFLLVTSNFHTARARRVFLKTERAMGGGPELRMVASADRYFAPDSWWRTREGVKIEFMEWSKTVAEVFGI